MVSRSMWAPLLALMLALAQGSGARGEEFVVFEGAGVCGPALLRFVEFLEEELGHVDGEDDHDDHRRALAEDEHGHGDEDEEEEALLQVGVCGAELYTVVFEGKLLNLNLTEHVVETCVNGTGTCEMTVCEGHELELVEYAVCCADVNETSPVTMDCHVEEVAEFVVEEEEYAVEVSAATWGNALGAVVLTSSLSLSGIIVVTFCAKRVDTKVLNDITALAIGVLLATVFVHILPEAVEEAGYGWELGSGFLGGVVCALFIHFGSTMLGLGHEHTPDDLHITSLKNQKSAMVDMEAERSDGSSAAESSGDADQLALKDGAPAVPSLVLAARFRTGVHGEALPVDVPLVANIVMGDGIHNMVDGIIIGLAFATCGDTTLGWITTLAVVAHELPQEIIDFMLLVRAGLSFKKALAWNFCSSLSSFVGVVLVLGLRGNIDNNTQAILLVFASGFLAYIALAELVPHIVHLDSNRRKFFRMFLVVVGACLIGVLGLTDTHCESGGHSDH